MHRPGKHHSHADGLSRHALWSCKCDKCPEYAPLLHHVTHEKDRVRIVTQSDLTLEHFDGYLELAEDDEPDDSPSFEHDAEDTSEDWSKNGLISIPDSVDYCYRVRGTSEAGKASPAIQALIDHSNVDCLCSGARSQLVGGNRHAPC